MRRSVLDAGRQERVGKGRRAWAGRRPVSGTFRRYRHPSASSAVEGRAAVFGWCPERRVSCSFLRPVRAPTPCGGIAQLPWATQKKAKAAQAIRLGRPLSDLDFERVITKVVAVESECGAGGLSVEHSRFPPLSSGGALIVRPRLPFPHPAHRTGHADLPASGSRTRLTPSSTARRAQAYSDVRARNARRGARVDSSHAVAVWICAWRATTGATAPPCSCRAPDTLC